jgi:hypothetical protein
MTGSRLLSGVQVGEKLETNKKAELPAWQLRLREPLEMVYWLTGILIIFFWMAYVTSCALL